MQEHYIQSLASVSMTWTSGLVSEPLLQYWAVSVADSYTRISNMSGCTFKTKLPASLKQQKTSSTSSKSGKSIRLNNTTGQVFHQVPKAMGMDSQQALEALSYLWHNKTNNISEQSRLLK